MTLSHLTLLISKSLPYPPPTREIMAATSGLLRNLDLLSLKAFSCVHIGRYSMQFSYELLHVSMDAQTISPSKLFTSFFGCLPFRTHLSPTPLRDSR
uniref:Uncharacterized protein n=1 Tax=Myoviridae sp. ctwwN25 TaxID=2825209 RepID=A0A8S5PP96_9CAUD|nr:MAG TPA: hypothetical protein [Myoviridae sp. ctwwN25]